MLEMLQHLCCFCDGKNPKIFSLKKLLCLNNRKFEVKKLSPHFSPTQLSVDHFTDTCEDNIYFV